MGTRVNYSFTVYDYPANEVVPMAVAAEQAGFKGGMPRVWDPERIFVLLDHHQPALSQALADTNAKVRREVERKYGPLRDAPNEETPA